MKMHPHLSLLLCLLLCCVACQKTTEDSTAPTIVLQTPMSNNSYASDSSIPIQLTLSDDIQLASYKVVIRNLDSDELVYIESQTTTLQRVVIDDELRISVPTATDFRLEIETVDASGNEQTDTSTVFSILPPAGGILQINFKLTYRDEPLVMFERYDYQDTRLFFTRFSTYLSNIALTDANTTTEIKDVDFLDLTPAHETLTDATNGFEYTIAGIPTGNYNALSFAIGIDENTNAQRPSSFPPSSPLSRSGEYWASWNSYIFQKTEAKLDNNLDGDFETQVALHLGANNAYRNKQLIKNMDIRTDKTTRVDITIDLYDMLVQNDEAYDLKNDHQIHSLSQIPLIEQLADNLVLAIQ